MVGHGHYTATLLRTSDYSVARKDEKYRHAASCYPKMLRKRETL